VLALLCAVVFGGTTYLIVLARNGEKNRAVVVAVLAGALGIPAFNVAHRTWLNHRKPSAAERRSAIEAIWQSDPALAAWSRFEPASYQAWLTAFEVGAVTKKPIPLDTRDGLISAGKHNSSFDSAVKQALALASDESLIAYADALVSAAEELEQRDAQACFRSPWATACASAQRRPSLRSCDRSRPKAHLRLTHVGFSRLPDNLIFRASTPCQANFAIRSR
jgi:hypothetical protein